MNSPRVLQIETTSVCNAHCILCPHDRIESIGTMSDELYLKITQQQLAEAGGVTPQHISLIEEGKNSPSLALLTKLAEELGVSIDYLVTGKEGIISDTVPAIKADKRLGLKAKRALISLVEELRAAAGLELEP